MIIRRALLSDVPFLCKLHIDSIRTLCSTHYTREQIRDWTGMLKPEGYVRAIEIYDFIVAAYSEIVGMCIFNPEISEITALYVDPRAARQGIGSALIREAEAMAGELAVNDLHLRSTLNAVQFYERMGFIRYEMLNYMLPSGTELPCIRMEKKLPQRTRNGK